MQNIRYHLLQLSSLISATLSSRCRLAVVSRLLTTPSSQPPLQATVVSSSTYQARKLLVASLSLPDIMSATVASLSFTSSLHPPIFTTTKTSNKKTRATQLKNSSNTIKSRWEKPLEELYNIKVERKVSPKRLEEVGVSKWSMWKTGGKCQLSWDWQVDQLVYVVEGEVRVVPEGSEKFMSFVAGDLIRYPKWFEADLFFNAPYQELYKFQAYGDD